MMDQRLAPGMPDREEPGLGAKMAGIGRNGPQRRRDGSEEQAIDDRLVLVGNPGDRRRHGEHDVEVVDGK